MLEGSLNYEEMLVRVAHIAVPEVADWCPVDLLNDAGRIRRLAVAHANPAKERFARELSERYGANVRPLRGTARPRSAATAGNSGGRA